MLKWGELPLAVKRIGQKNCVTYLHLTSVFRCTIALRYHLFCFISVTTRGLDLKHLRAPKRSLLCPAMYMRLQVLCHL